METKTINGLTFFEFFTQLSGFFVFDKKTKEEVFRFELFHSGKTLQEIKENYNLEPRPENYITFFNHENLFENNLN